MGKFIRAFGRFGFDAGSTLAGSDLRIGVIATNTVLAGAAGGITSMLDMPAMLRQRTAAGEAA